MGKSLEMEVVAEGVEARDQLEFLRKHGCFFAQGLLFGEVMEADKLLEIMLAQRSGTGHFAALCASSRAALSAV
jgi:sensor c-di-GMP phosphodiesterase-like protein